MKGWCVDMGKGSRFDGSRQSSFVCLKCKNKGISGITRKSQRSNNHIKDLFCCTCKDTTKHLEIRYFEHIVDKESSINHYHEMYYGKNAHKELFIKDSSRFYNEGFCCI